MLVLVKNKHMTFSLPFTHGKTERDAQDQPHTPQEALGSTAITHTLNPEDQAAVDAVKRDALASLEATGQPPAEHMPAPVTLSPQTRTEIDAVKAAELSKPQEPTT